MRRHSTFRSSGRCGQFARVGLLAGAISTIGLGVARAQTPSSTDGPWQTYGTENGEWRSYAGDIAGTKYSPLDQIDADNFSELEIAWEWTSVDALVSRSTPGGGEWWAPLDTIVESLVDDTPNLYRDSQPPNLSRLQATPLMVGGVLYFNTPLSQGVAVDAATGQTLWAHYYRRFTHVLLRSVHRASISRHTRARNGCAIRSVDA